MDVLISLRRAGHEIAEGALEHACSVLTGIGDAGVIQGWRTGAVFDAALGRGVDRLRVSLDAVPASRTRVWGREGDDPDGQSCESSQFRLVRWQRCVAECEPSILIDVRFGDEDSTFDVLSSRLPFFVSVGVPVTDGLSVTLHAESREALVAVWKAWCPEELEVPIRQIEARRSPDGNPLPDESPRVRGSARGNAVHRLPATSVGLDRTLRRLLPGTSHVTAEHPWRGTPLEELSFETTLRIAYAAGGYGLMRRTLRGEPLQEHHFEAWLSSISRGGRVVREDDAWYVARRRLDRKLDLLCGTTSRLSYDQVLRADVLPPVAGPTRLLVDISALAKFDAQSGIQRVVRNVLRHLEGLLSDDVQVVPIAFLDDGRCRQAARFYSRFMGLPYDLPDDEDVIPRPGDVFLGLDLSAHIVPRYRGHFEWMRRLGIPIHFVVYDLLPLQRPECFDPRVVDLFREWYAAVADLADGVLCISRAVADEFLEWLDEYAPNRESPVDVGYFHLGADIVAEGGSAGTGEPPFNGRTYALMVSTLEPRKGYVQALDAFEMLWADGEDLALVIVGKQGWLMETLVSRLNVHPELGRRLHWFAGIDDEALVNLYRHAAFLLSASEGEGFGLPLIEASQYGVPVVCRDLPVFREIAGDAASYFTGYEPEILAAALRAWPMREDAQADRRIPWKTWEEASAEFVTALTSQRPYRRWTRTSDRRVFSSYNPRLFTAAGERFRGDIITVGRAGVLLHGPYQPLRAGRYRLRIFGDLDAGQALRMDIVVDQGRREVAAWSVSSAHAGVLSDTLFDLSCDVDDLEVRIVVNADHRVRVKKLEITPDTVSMPVENLSI